MANNFSKSELLKIAGRSSGYVPVNFEYQQRKKNKFISHNLLGKKNKGKSKKSKNIDLDTETYQEQTKKVAESYFNYSNSYPENPNTIFYGNLNNQNRLDKNKKDEEDKEESSWLDNTLLYGGLGSLGAGAGLYGLSNTAFNSDLKNRVSNYLDYDTSNTTPKQHLDNYLNRAGNVLRGGTLGLTPAQIILNYRKFTGGKVGPSSPYHYGGFKSGPAKGYSRFAREKFLNEDTKTAKRYESNIDALQTGAELNKTELFNSYDQDNIPSNFAEAQNVYNVYNSDSDRNIPDRTETIETLTQYMSDLASQEYNKNVADLDVGKQKELYKSFDDYVKGRDKAVWANKQVLDHTLGNIAKKYYNNYGRYADITNKLVGSTEAVGKGLATAGGLMTAAYLLKRALSGNSEEDNTKEASDKGEKGNGIPRKYGKRPRFDNVRGRDFTEKRSAAGLFEPAKRRSTQIQTPGTITREKVRQKQSQSLIKGAKDANGNNDTGFSVPNGTIPGALIGATGGLLGAYDSVEEDDSFWDKLGKALMWGGAGASFGAGTGAGINYLKNNLVSGAVVNKNLHLPDQKGPLYDDDAGYKWYTKEDNSRIPENYKVKVPNKLKEPHIETYLDAQFANDTGDPKARATADKVFSKLNEMYKDHYGSAYLNPDKLKIKDVNSSYLNFAEKTPIADLWRNVRGILDMNEDDELRREKYTNQAIINKYRNQNKSDYSTDSTLATAFNWSPYGFAARAGNYGISKLDSLGNYLEDNNYFNTDKQPSQNLYPMGPR